MRPYPQSRQITLSVCKLQRDAGSWSHLPTSATTKQAQICTFSSPESLSSFKIRTRELDDREKKIFTTTSHENYKSAQSFLRTKLNGGFSPAILKGNWCMFLRFNKLFSLVQIEGRSPLVGRSVGKEWRIYFPSTSLLLFSFGPLKEEKKGGRSASHARGESDATDSPNFFKRKYSFAPLIFP